MLKSRLKYLIVVVILLAGCTGANIPKKYSPRLGQIHESVYGSWVRIYQKTITDSLKPDIHEGEFIVFHANTLYFLQKNGTLSSLFIDDIGKAELYIFRSQAPTYLALTVAFYLPSIIGAIAIQQPAFLVFGLPGLISGFIITLSEMNNTNNRLIYPDHNLLHEFIPYSRFPQGKPLNFKLSHLQNQQ